MLERVVRRANRVLFPEFELFSDLTSLAQAYQHVKTGHMRRDVLERLRFGTAQECAFRKHWWNRLLPLINLKESIVIKAEQAGLTSNIPYFTRP